MATQVTLHTKDWVAFCDQPRYTNSNLSHTTGMLALNSQPRRAHSLPKNAVCTRCQWTREPSPSPSVAAKSAPTCENGTMFTSLVSMMHTGWPENSVTTLKSPGLGMDLPADSKTRARPAVARFLPERTN